MHSMQDGLISCKPLDRAGPLSPSQDAIDTISSAGQKRMYNDVGDVSNICETFRVSLHDSKGSSTFKPQMLLPRGCLPLAYLDITESPESEQELRCFSAYVPALESIYSDGHEDPATCILIAERNGNSLHAIERIRSGVYAQCRLGNWITIDDLKDRSLDLSVGHRSKRTRLDETDKWWRGIVANEQRYTSLIDLQTRQRHSTKIYDLTKPSYVPKKPALPIKEVPLVKPTEQDNIEFIDSYKMLSQEPAQVSTDEPSQDLDDLLSTIKAQYGEFLYKSKGSTAYFAKGPLSRARAAFLTAGGMPASSQRLIEYLRTLIIPLNLLDKKYRDTLPALVTRFLHSIVNEVERIEVAAKSPQYSRKPKKEKIGKNGLYPQEEENIRQWWLEQLVSVPTCTSAELRDELIKATLLQQRTRETYLQIILILEILALERILPVPSIEEAIESPEESQQPQKKKKPKKKQDLVVLLDLSVDKLCIWQSMAIEENETPEGSKATESLDIGTLSNKIPDKSQLREFCVDVVLPFYDARLPEASRTICKKLGGPLPHSAKRPTLKKAASSLLRPQKPGAAVKRPQPREARRTLERVLTDETTSRRPMPTLCRSATDSFLPHLKREASDVSLSSVPLNKSTFHRSNRYSQREVDLAAVSQAAEAKVKKKANVEQELQGAIAALKRPNPRMALKEFVEAADRRAAGPKSRKPKNPVRNPLTQGVQIMATPSANRRKDVSYGLHSRQTQAQTVHQELEEVPPSSCTHVPASVIKERTDAIAGRSLDVVRHSLTRTIEQTPTKGPSKFAHVQSMAKPRLADRNIEMTPSSVTRINGLDNVQETCQKPGYQKSLWTASALATPSRNVYSTDLKADSLNSGVQGTLVDQLKRVSGNVIRASSKTASWPAADKGGESIYTDLGWDDDFDELM